MINSLPRVLLAAALLALATACHRPPQTAAQLLERLPRRFTGEVLLQGQSAPQAVRIESRQLAARDEHLLEFSGVNLVLLTPDGSVQAEHPAACRGTISAPGLEIRLEELGGAEDMLKAGSFAGQLSADLQTVEATWTTSLGSKGSLKLTATP